MTLLLLILCTLPATVKLFANTSIQSKQQTSRQPDEVQTMHQNGEGDYSDFEHVMCIGAKQPDLSISKMLFYCNFHAQSSLGLTEYAQNIRKLASVSSLGENGLFHPCQR